MPRFTFIFRGEERSGEFDESTTLLEAAQSLDVPIISTCGGQPNCTDCRCKIVEGYESLNDPEFEEIQLMGSVSHITKVRLACQARATGDLRIEPQRLKGDRLAPKKVKQGPLGRKDKTEESRPTPNTSRHAKPPQKRRDDEPSKRKNRPRRRGESSKNVGENNKPPSSPNRPQNAKSTQGGGNGSDNKNGSRRKRNRRGRRRGRNQSAHPHDKTPNA